MSGPAGHGDPAEVVRLLQLLRRTVAVIECTVVGGSMGTSIPDGATVRVRLDGAKEAPEGCAVALLLGGDTFAIHRLVRRGRSARSRGFAIMLGDGNVFCDAPQRDADLLGTVLVVRRPGQLQWENVPAPARYRPVRRAVTATFAWAMGAALDLSPRLGFVVKDALVLAFTPLVWLRPYTTGRARSTSRLVGVQAVAAPR